MANKYSKWYRGSFYTDVQELKQEYPSLLKVPFYHGPQCDVKMNQYIHNIYDKEYIDTDKVKKMMICIMAMGKNMTMEQLRAYLLLKSFTQTSHLNKCLCTLKIQ